MSIVNIAAYKFVSLADQSALRGHLLADCAGLALKSTILLALEGVNLFLAGARAAVDADLAPTTGVMLAATHTPNATANANLAAPATP